MDDDISRPLYLVTGADWTHGQTLLQYLASVRRWEPDIEVIVYDLGLRADQREAVAAIVTPGQIKAFDFGAYPDYFDISRNAGEYAWKPVILAGEMAQRDAPVCWMDAGNLVVKPLRQIRSVLRRRGFFARSSSGKVPEWTHPGMLQWMGLPPDWGQDFFNLAGGCVGVDPRHPLARQVIEEWARCAMIRRCIAPEGSSRANHRQDQALLTVLAYRSGLIERPVSRWLWRGLEYQIQRDIDPKPGSDRPSAG